MKDVAICKPPSDSKQPPCVSDPWNKSTGARPQATGGLLEGQPGRAIEAEEAVVSLAELEEEQLERRLVEGQEVRGDDEKRPVGGVAALERLKALSLMNV